MAEDMTGLLAMSIDINGSADTQNIGYVRNWIEFHYGQDCGQYKVNFEPVDSSCDMSAAFTANAEAQYGVTTNNRND